MTRNEFINDIDTWWDLIDFCREEDCDVCEDVISDDDLSDYIEEDIENAAHDGMSWQEIRDRLNDLDTSYDYYVNDGYMIYNGLDNEDADCLPEDEDTANQNSEDTTPLEVEFAVTELISMCITDIKIKKSAEDAERRREQVEIDRALAELLPL